MKNYLTISIWLIIFAVTFGLACQPEVDIKAEATSAITEPSAEMATEVPAVTEPPVETATEVPAVPKPSVEAAAEVPAVTEPPVEAAAEVPAVTEPPAETTTDAIAVTVNGVDITEADIEVKIKPQLEKMAEQLPPQVIGQYKKQLRQKALEGMIVEKLLDEKVKAANIVVTEEEVIDHIKEIASQQGLSLDDFKALIEAYGKNFGEWKQQMQFRRGLSYNKFFEAQWAGKINITEDDAKKYYSENTKHFEVPEQVRASHILISPDTADPNTDPNEAKAKAKAKAQKLLRQIIDGADFATLAKANSSCPSSARGGDLGLFRKGQMVPAFEEAAFELEVGQVSDIVETQFGYHIIKATDHKDTSVVQFEQAKDDILNMLTQKKLAELAKEYIELLKAEADIVYPVESKSPGSERNF